MAGFLDFLTGSSGKFRQNSLFNPQQNAGLDQLLSQGLGNMNFQPIEQQARSNFATQTVPGLAERFTSMGGGQHSSAFQGALGQAGSGLEEALASLRSQYGMQQTQMGMQHRFENTYMQGQPGVLQHGLGQGLANLLPLLMFL